MKICFQKVNLNDFAYFNFTSSVGSKSLHLYRGKTNKMKLLRFNILLCYCFQPFPPERSCCGGGNLYLLICKATMMAAGLVITSLIKIAISRLTVFLCSNERHFACRIENILLVALPTSHASFQILFFPLHLLALPLENQSWIQQKETNYLNQRGT